jgi:hypothetical protein
MSVEPCTPAFPTLPTELLILILSYLPVVELCAVQRTCHRFHDIVVESAHLQYILRSQINGVEDLLPPDCPFSERLELLRRHENAWSNLQLKLSHEFASPLLDRHFLQDGYLIYNKIAGNLQYGYVDLLSAVPDEELCWAHISREEIRHPLCVVFAVDSNLAVVLRYLSPLLSTECNILSIAAQDSASQARFARQAYVSRFLDRRAASPFFQAHGAAPFKYRRRRGLRGGGDPGRLCPDHGDVRTRCLLLLPCIVEIGSCDLGECFFFPLMLRWLTRSFFFWSAPRSSAT